MKFSLCNHHTFTSSPVLEPCEHGYGSGSIDGQGFGNGSGFGEDGSRSVHLCGGWYGPGSGHGSGADYGYAFGSGNGRGMGLEIYENFTN